MGERKIAISLIEGHCSRFLALERLIAPNIEPTSGNKYKIMAVLEIKRRFRLKRKSSRSDSHGKNVV